ncbi:uncharacterized protein PHALS_14622 [Plasmopara halstedii]|uniref:Uncharacterized protein n=1 Tax=Plasmopara halstedii TaxID=4781 RepID=A0A0P1ANJ2_PLAHL|nr:uncharacterized protein PHALS_14622 [Plasmopara halstedii]CEG42397.1 hypothetical protein PHALS_14622 [Plasmopara halstedii]|eukprot:XP_024578766.1 hypothetical protein PHALS_14622 [Plasmopara halstedii]
MNSNVIKSLSMDIAVIMDVPFCWTLMLMLLSDMMMNHVVEAVYLVSLLCRRWHQKPSHNCFRLKETLDG